MDRASIRGGVLVGSPTSRPRLVARIADRASAHGRPLNLVGALEPPTRGRITVAGHDLAGLDEAGRTAFRRETVGFVFQFFNLIPTLTARENVELVLELTGRPDAARRAIAALHAVGLGDRLDHFPSGLSGGEQQRVAIARAVAKDPAVLLCDEPTGALDLETSRVVLDVLHRVNRESGRTVLMVTHNSAIAAMADRVVRVRSGAIVADKAVTAPVAPSAVSW